MTRLRETIDQAAARAERFGIEVAYLVRCGVVRVAGVAGPIAAKVPGLARMAAHPRRLTGVAAAGAVALGLGAGALATAAPTPTATPSRATLQAACSAVATAPACACIVTAARGAEGLSSPRQRELLVHWIESRRDAAPDLLPTGRAFRGFSGHADVCLNAGAAAQMRAAMGV